MKLQLDFDEESCDMAQKHLNCVHVRSLMIDQQRHFCGSMVGLVYGLIVGQNRLGTSGNQRTNR